MGSRKKKPRESWGTGIGIGFGHRGPRLTLTVAQLRPSCLGKSKEELRPSSLYPQVKGKVLNELEEL